MTITRNISASCKGSSGELGANFRSDPGKEAFLLMPAELKIGRYKILDYDEKLLGRKLATDDRA
jgi:hypothetical protein